MRFFTPPMARVDFLMMFAESCFLRAFPSKISLSSTSFMHSVTELHIRFQEEVLRD